LTDTNSFDNDPDRARLVQGYRRGFAEEFPDFADFLAGRGI